MTEQLTENNEEVLLPGRNFTDGELKYIAEKYLTKRANEAKKKAVILVNIPVISAYNAVLNKTFKPELIHTEVDLARITEIMTELMGKEESAIKEQPPEPEPEPVEKPSNTTKNDKDSFGFPEISDEEKERARRYRESRPDLY